MKKTLLALKIDKFLFEVYPDHPSFDFKEVNQVHGTNIEDVSNTEAKASADGMISSLPLTIPLVIKTADCLPIASVGKSAVALIHAGWKGLADGILESSKLRAISPTSFIIGPHIHSCCFEVSAGFENQFKSGEQYISTIENKYYFNLTKLAVDIIKKIYPTAKIEVTQTCTACDTRYNSYRRNKTTVRNYNVLKAEE